MDLSTTGCKRGSSEVVDGDGAFDLSCSKRLSLEGDQNSGTRKTVKDESVESEHENDSQIQKGWKDLSCFTLKSVLNNSAESKLLTVEGTFPDGESAVVILDKKPFSAEELPELFSTGSKLNLIFQNDIYGNYDCFPVGKCSAIKATVVHPATEKHIEKYKRHDAFLIEETPDLYEKVVLPHIESSQLNLQWVFNILEHKKEADRIVFEDSDPKNGFILLPDLKWDGKSIENLYLCAIVHAKGIKSLRNLSTQHLPLLKNILESGSKAITEKYGLKKSQLRIYLHYQPSYYHLHVHFTHLYYHPPGINAEKSHLLQTVISNIEAKGNYYQEITLPFVVKKNDLLFKKLEESKYQF